MFLFSLPDIVQVPFGWLLSVLYQFTQSYGWALIIFSLVVKLVLMPASAKAKKSSMKMSRLTPQLEAIKAKYPDDQQKQGEAMRALYKQEGVSMGGGCLWSLLPLLILFPLYTVVRQPITYMLQESAEAAAKIVSIIKDALPDAFGANEFYEQMIAAPLIPQFAQQIKEALPDISDATLKGVDFSFLGFALNDIPQWQFWNWKITAETPLWSYLGCALMPLLSAGGQLLSMFLSQKMNNSLVTDEKGLEDKETAQKADSNQTMKMMMWISPIMSLWIGFSMPAALSLYWFAQGIFSTASDLYLTAKYRKIYDAEDAERLKKAMEADAIEAEKERIRAERRAANPDGITTNTSKKKIQQSKQREQEAAKAAAAREYAAKKGEVVEEAPEKTVLSGIPDRPNCRGRAYDPNRYTNTEE
ncbi:MAG: YidC/Oxa1 family membrane protein insertase [Oscillospiraceae bacterium]|nr:YidC/Oxa1 family membrane protein insertase [Oscillospiraceae bacterium]